MKKLLVAGMLLLGFSLSHSVVISGFQFDGFSLSDTNTILNFFYENVSNKNWDKAELDSALARVAERMTITGWYKNVSISNVSTNDQEAIILFNLQERIQYTAWLGDLYIGLTKFNLWGKGKLLSFEVGPHRQLVFIEDRMFNFTRFSYLFKVGGQEDTLTDYTNNQYVNTKIISRILQADIGYRLIPDGFIHFKFGSTKLETLTNSMKIDSYFHTGLSFKYDKTAGFPAVNKGWNTSLDISYIIGPNVLKTELKASFYQKISETIHLSQSLHAGYISSPSIPFYHMFSLRNIDGLRTLTQGIDGLIGTAVWDAELEARWAFWEVIPFLFLFDMQIEAVVFVEAGEARINSSDLGNPHFVAGGGLRFYMNTFVVRAEMGIDETGESSVSSSFSAAF